MATPDTDSINVMVDGERWWTTTQAARWYGCKSMSLRQMMRLRGYPPVGLVYDTRGGRIYLYRVRDVLALKATARKHRANRTKHLQTTKAREKARRSIILAGIARRRAKREAQ